MIGETAEVGDDVTIYQGVTLGGTGFARGKRHPTVGNEVMIGAGSALLGPIVIGDRAKIGANSVVIHDVPKDATVVGNPGHPVRVDGKKPEGPDADWVHLPDPVADAISGLANRLCRSGAAAACVTFPGDVSAFPTRRTALTGYPLRQGFQRRVPEAPPRRLLVMGGSQGARRINETVWDGLERLLERFEEVIHLTGPQGERKAAALARPRYRACPFSDDVPRLMGEADLVVCRAGVGTCAELTATGLPAVLVPGTFGGGHQERNAEELVRVGAAVRIGDDELSAPELLRTLDALDADRLRSMAAASAALGRPDAARAIVRVLEEVAPGGGQ